MGDASYYNRQDQPNLLNPIGFAQSLGQPGVSSFFKFIDLIVSKSVSGFVLQYPKLMMHLAPIMVAECTTEYEKNSMLTGLTRYIMVLLSPEVKQILDDPEIDETVKNDIQDRFNNLKAHSRACGNVKIDSKIVRSGNYATYKFETNHSTYRERYDDKGNVIIPKTAQESQTDMEPISAVVECTEPVIEIGWNIARDNGYKRINCHAENTLTEALTLASDIGLLSPDDNLVFEERSVSPEDVDAKVRRQEQILKRQSGPAPYTRRGRDE